MDYSFLMFPGFREKAVTLSYDDGVVADKRLTGCVIRTGDVIWLMLRLCLAGAGGFMILIAIVTCLVGKGTV